MKMAYSVEVARPCAAFWYSLMLLATGCATSSEPVMCSQRVVRDCVCADGQAPRAGSCERRNTSGLSAPGAGSDESAVDGGVDPQTLDSGAALEAGGEQHTGSAAADAGDTADSSGRPAERVPPADSPDAGADAAASGAAGSPASQGGAGDAGSAAAAGGAAHGPTAGAAAPPPENSALTSEPQDDAVHVFDQTKLRTYNIQIAPADLAMLDQNPGAEQWVPGMLELDGVVYGPIGVRYKGGYSGFQPPCAAGVGSPKLGKCSIKLGFDEYDDKGRLFGLKKLNLHSMNADASMMHDRLGYALFREFGVAAPRATHAIVYVNGVAQGLFIAVEQIDGRFTRARFADGGEGNVYKEIWPLYTDPTVYGAALETNEDAAQVEGMVAFSESLTHGGADLGSFIDRDYTLRYLAVDRVIINDDGAMHFWCSDVASGNSPTDVGNHNYYWYQEQTPLAQPANKFWLLPWDLDMTFAFDRDAHIITPWYETAACSCMQSGAGYQIAASCDPLVQHFISWKSDYDQLVDRFLQGPFAAQAVDAKLAAWIAQIEPAAAELADTPNAHAGSAWQEALDALRSQIASAREHRGYAY